MSKTDRGTAAEPFFLKVGAEQRFCLYYPPHPGTYRGSVIHVPPFAEELNKSRRLIALQARALAAAGLAVLQIDLAGCGDSSGDFRDATWKTWKNDLALAREWLTEHHPGPVNLWGVRLGALLALDFARDASYPISRLVLWQPVVDGAMFLTQFLRLRMANEMLRGLSRPPMGTDEMRKALAAGETLEIAGYELSPALAASIDNLKLAHMAMKDIPIHWLEVIAGSNDSLSPATLRIANTLQEQGVVLHAHLVSGEKFWVSPEIVECPALLSATTSILVQDPRSEFC